MTHTKTIKNISRLAALVAAVALSACGGGGGSTDTTTPTTPSTPTTPVFQAANLVSTVPVPTYAANSEELGAFNELNAAREHCGFGKLAQNTKIDVAAQAHADWLLINNYNGHYETSGTPGYTGVFPADRMVAAGYGGANLFTSSEDQSGLFSSNKTGFGALAVRGLLNAPYHALSMISGYRDVGVSVRSTLDAGVITSSRTVANLDFAYKNVDGPQLMASDEVKTYPCAGSVGIDRALYGESPSPVPSRDLSTNPIGSSVMVSVREGNLLAITSAQMIKVSTGAAVVLRAPSTMANDPNAGYLKGHQAYVSADSPLDALTQYQVTLNGTNNGVAFSRSFTFTTGN